MIKSCNFKYNQVVIHFSFDNLILIEKYIRGKIILQIILFQILLYWKIKSRALQATIIELFLIGENKYFESQEYVFIIFQKLFDDKKLYSL